MIFQIRYHSTNCYFLPSSTGPGLLAVDAGWPCTLFEYARMMKSIGCHLESISWAIVTHFHMDHAGLIGEFLDRGITCAIFENQAGVVDQMEKTIEKTHKDYKKIDAGKLRCVSTAESRAFLAGIGIGARTVITDYHSTDSITLVTDEGEALIGDLPPQGQMMPDDTRFLDAWRTVWAAGGRVAYPSHANAFQVSDPGP